MFGDVDVHFLRKRITCIDFDFCICELFVGVGSLEEEDGEGEAVVGLGGLSFV